MPTKAVVRRHLEELLSRTLGNEDVVRSAVPERRVLCCKVPDLEAAWYAEIDAGRISSPSETKPDERVDVTLTVRSQDLVDLVEGRLSFVHALATGQVRIEASFSDLLRLRGLF